MRFVAAISLLMVCACSQSGDDITDVTLPTQEQIRFADEAVPTAPDLAATYNRSCRSCHGVDGMGAPLTGHSTDWNARIEQRGMDGLMTSTKNGFNGMPARGLCEDCSDDEFLALITFMSEGAVQ